MLGNCIKLHSRSTFTKKQNRRTSYIIFLIIVISLFISSTANYQEKSQKDNATIIQILKDNEKLQLEIIDLTTQDTIELGSAEWFPTRSEWTNMSKHNMSIKYK
jgi:hypothetical protein